LLEHIQTEDENEGNK